MSKSTPSLNWSINFRSRSHNLCIIRCICKDCSLSLQRILPGYCTQLIFSEGYRHHCRIAFSEPLCNYTYGPVLRPRLGHHLKFPGRPVSQPPSHWYVAGLLSRLTAGKDRAMTPLLSEARKSRFILFCSEVETSPGVNNYAWLYHSSCVLTRQTCRRTAHCG